MISRIIIYITALLVSVFCTPLSADVADNKNMRSEKSAYELTQTEQKKLLTALREELIKKDKKLAELQSERHKFELEYTKKYYSYLAEKADVNLEQFRWQRSASEWLLWLVVVVVLSGVVFSGIQLWRASSIKDLGGESTVEIETSKVRITTSVVGVIVLAISIVFFYFFLIEVYRVKVIDMAPSEVRPPSVVTTTRN
jgi:hypothetical protein